jgi:hypothetical protein
MQGAEFGNNERPGARQMVSIDGFPAGLVEAEALVA